MHLYGIYVEIRIKNLNLLYYLRNIMLKINVKQFSDYNTIPVHPLRDNFRGNETFCFSFNLHKILGE